VGLRPLACWNCGFESRHGHGYLSNVIPMHCQVEVFAAGRKFVQRSPTECGVTVEGGGGTSLMSRLWPTKRYWAIKIHTFMALIAYI